MASGEQRVGSIRHPLFRYSRRRSTANHLGRFARFALDSGARSTAAATYPHFFCTSCSTCLTDRRVGFSRALAARKQYAPSVIGGATTSEKPLCYRYFQRVGAKSRIALHDRSKRCIARAIHVGQVATSSVDTRAIALHCAKMLVFLSRCSNPGAVFAIPAGTVRHRHSLIG